MDGVSSVASVVTVVTLAIQLGQTIQKINRLLRNVEEAPKEVVRLIETLDQLHDTLHHVKELLEQQLFVLCLPGSPLFITRALGNCEKHINELKILSIDINRAFDRQRKVRRTWASMRFVLKKHDLEEIRCRLRDAKMDLQFAISSNSWQLQLHQIQSFREEKSNTMISNLHKSSVEVGSLQSSEASFFKPYSSNPAKNTFFVPREALVPYYRGVLGTVTMRKKNKYSSSRAIKMPAVVTESAWIFRPSFVSYLLEVYYIQSFRHISRTLNVYPVLCRTDEAFSMCFDGDVHGLQELFSKEIVSPFVSDEDGWTLLHYAAFGFQPEVCALLLQLGVDPERVDSMGMSALNYIGSLSQYNLRDQSRKCDAYKRDLSNTYRFLAQTQDSLSARDLSILLTVYIGPPEIAGLTEMVPFDPINDPITYPPLAMALRLYAVAYLAEYKYENLHLIELQHHGELKQWESLIKRLLRTGADLHAPISRHLDLSNRTEVFTESGTPLDELFTYTNTPAESRVVADGWLQILRSEGYDVSAYIEKESDLRCTQPQIITSLSNYILDIENPRELLFTLDEENSGIYWEWWIDPSSSTHLVRSTFKQMLMLPDFHNPHDSSWEETWPFRYPNWHEFCIQPYCPHRAEASIMWQQLYDAAQLRANRRLQKRHAKKMYSRGLKTPRMPGAWHD